MSDLREYAITAYFRIFLPHISRLHGPHILKKMSAFFWHAYLVACVQSGLSGLFVLYPTSFLQYQYTSLLFYPFTSVLSFEKHWRDLRAPSSLSRSRNRTLLPVIIVFPAVGFSSQCSCYGFSWFSTIRNFFRHELKLWNLILRESPCCSASFL